MDVQYLHFVKEQYDVNTLWSELEAAGVVILDFLHKDPDIWIGIPSDAPQEMIDACNTVVANHVPTPPPPPPPSPDEIVIQDLQAATTLDDVKNALIKRFQANLPQE